MRQRDEHPGTAGDADHGSFINVDLAGIEQKLLGRAGEVAGEAGFHLPIRAEDRAVAIGIPIGPSARADHHISAGGQQGGGFVEVDRKPFDVHLGSLRQRGARHGFGAGVIGQNPRQAVGPQRHRACELGEEHRAAGTRFGGAVEVRIGHRAVAGFQVDPAVEAHRGAAVDHAELIHAAAGHRRVAGEGFDEAGVAGRAGVVVRRADPHIEAAEPRILAVVSGHRRLQAGGQNGLTGFGREGPGVGDIGTDQQDAAAVAAAIGGAAEHRPRLHGHIAVAAGGRRSLRDEILGAIRPARHAEAGEQKLCVAVVQEALFDQLGVDRQRRNGEAAGIDLAGPAEDDPILINDIYLAVGLDRAEDLGGIAGRIGDLVEGDPLGGVLAAGGLVERERGAFANIESFPVEQRLLGGLLDRDARLLARDGLHGCIGTGPRGGVRGGGRGGFQAARGETVRHCGEIGTQLIRTADGGAAGGGLQHPHGIERLVGPTQDVLGIHPRGVRGGGGWGSAGGGCARGAGGGGATPAKNVTRLRGQAGNEHGEASDHRRAIA